jgi:hypothetical protein
MRLPQKDSLFLLDNAMPTFESIIKKHRRRHLEWIQDAEDRILRILRNAADEMEDVVKKHVGKGSLKEAHATALLEDLRRILGDVHTKYVNLLPVMLLGAAQIAADRESDFARELLVGFALEKA